MLHVRVDRNQPYRQGSEEEEDDDEAVYLAQDAHDRKAEKKKTEKKKKKRARKLKEDEENAQKTMKRAWIPNKVRKPNKVYQRVRQVKVLDYSCMEKDEDGYVEISKHPYIP